ncbi:hypothetical protein BGZ83_006369 [Gryganskiella cystojenkinii]|nr:hypothetical protein BGZ83_006369 [Gryganskiella cystojenkinii]
MGQKKRDQQLLFGALEKRPDLRDLVPSTKRTGVVVVPQEGLEVMMLSAGSIRERIQKRRKLKWSAGGFDPSSGNPLRRNPDSGTDISCGSPAIQDSEEPEQSKTTMENNQATAQQLDDLEEAVRSLREKLEILQPEGKRPSDIEAAAKTGTDGGSSTESVDETSEEHEMVLSQAVSSQRSILIWDEIRVLVEHASAGAEEISRQAQLEISRLGLEDLEDNALHRLCVNELFVQDQKERGDDPEGSMNETMASRQVSFDLKSTPSRLFLDSMLSAGKAHGRAIVDGVLLPIARDYHRYSKHISELIQKIMKEQTSATMIHFLSQMFDSVPRRQETGAAIGVSQTHTFSRLSIVFVTETHLSTLQMILGFNNVPCPVPTRLWTRLNELLEQLWDHVSAVVTAESSNSSSHSSVVLNMESVQTSILKTYLSQSLWETISGTTTKGGGTVAKKSTLADVGPIIRLSNAKLIQMLMTWVLRQGPVCSDIGCLRRMQLFCRSKLDERMAKGLVSKLDAFIKKRTK